MSTKQNLNDENKTAAVKKTSAARTSASSRTAAAKAASSKTAAKTKTAAAVKKTAATAKTSAAGKTTAARTTSARTTSASKTASSVKAASASKTTSAVKPSVTRTSVKPAAEKKEAVKAEPVRIAAEGKPTLEESMEQNRQVQALLNNFPGRDSDDGRKYRGIIILCAVLFLIAAFLFLFTFIRSRGSSSAVTEGSQVTGELSSSEKLSRENALKLVNRYIDNGMYDQAVSLLEKMLMESETGDDPELLALIDKAAGLKKKSEEEFRNQLRGDGDGNSSDSSDSSGLDLSALGLDSITKNQQENNQAIRDLAEAVRAQQQKDAERERLEAERARLEAERAEQKRMAEEKKAKEEAERRAMEEKLARESREKAELIKNINDEIAQGKALLNSGDVEEAIRHFNKAKSMLPSDDKDFKLSKLSEIAQALQDAAENTSAPGNAAAKSAALSFASAAGEINGGSAQSHYIFAKNAMEKKDYETAEKELKEALKKDSKNPLYYYELGRIQFNRKNYSGAASSFQTAISLKSDYSAASFNLGVTYERLNDLPRALSSYRKACSINKDYESAWAASGRILVKQKDYKGAVEAFTQAVRINPSKSDYHKELGSAYSDLGNYAQAETSYQKAISYMGTSAKDPVTYYNLSSVLFEQKKNAAALENAKKAYDLKEYTNVNAVKVNIVYHYALVCQETGSKEAAIKLYSEAINLDPSNVKARTNMGVLCLEDGDADTAIVMLSSAYKSDKRNFEIDNNLGNAYRMKNDYDNAIKYYLEALSIQGTSNTVRMNLAKCYASSQNLEQARVTYEDVVKSDSKNWEAFLELAKVCVQLKHPDAKKWLIYLQENQKSYRPEEVKLLLEGLE